MLIFVWTNPDKYRSMVVVSVLETNVIMYDKVKSLTTIFHKSLLTKLG